MNSGKAVANYVSLMATPYLYNRECTRTNVRTYRMYKHSYVHTYVRKLVL
jgi:hypothetical protein